MSLSYWEYQTWLSNIDFTIVGSGIVGLTTSIFLKEKYPKAKILILEKGVLPQGASTKNAGFACFGSISELISDLETHSEQEVFELVQQRRNGIQLLREVVGDSAMDLAIYGGHELFLNSQKSLFEKCQAQMEKLNTLLKPVFGEIPFERRPNSFGFEKTTSEFITHRFEGQLNTGKMMRSLLQKAQEAKILIVNSVELKEFVEGSNGVSIQTDKFEFESNKLIFANNGFASELLKVETKPARAQVLVTEPIENLKINGTFHLDEGYYYFRNIDNRILLGGGRNLDFETEVTTTFGQTQLVQDQLERLLKEVILPKTPFEIDQRWSGIMGVGPQKRPIVKQLSNHVYCGVRLGGMGVAIGSLIGKEITALL